MQKWIYRNPKVPGTYLCLQRVSDAFYCRAVGDWFDNGWRHPLSDQKLRCVEAFAFIPPVPSKRDING